MYLFYLGHSGLVFAKVQNLLSADSFHACVYFQVAPNSVLDKAKRMGKCNADIEMLRQ